MFYPVNIINTKTTIFNIQVIGIFVKYNKNNYLVVPHLSLDVNIVKIFDTEFKDFQYAEWNDLIIVKYNPPKNIFIFTSFMNFKLDYSHIININKNKSNILYLKYFPINMIPDNPELLYFVIQSSNTQVGQPVYYNNKLYGIVIRSENDKCYVLPSIYIKNTIKRQNNNIYILKNMNKITKINKYNIYNNHIYSPELRIYIRLSAYINLISDNKKKIQIITNNLTYNTHFYKFEKNRRSENIIINSKILHYARLYDEKLLMLIFNNMKKKQTFIHNIKQNYLNFVY
jgi:hypothetical protein